MIFFDFFYLKKICELLVLDVDNLIIERLLYLKYSIIVFKPSINNQNICIIEIIP